MVLGAVEVALVQFTVLGWWCQSLSGVGGGGCCMLLVEVGLALRVGGWAGEETFVVVTFL